MMGSTTWWFTPKWLCAPELSLDIAPARINWGVINPLRGEAANSTPVTKKKLVGGIHLPL